MLNQNKEMRWELEKMLKDFFNFVKVFVKGQTN